MILRKIYLFLFLLIATVACTPNDEFSVKLENDSEPKNALLMYASSANNLYYYIENDINEVVNNYVKADDKDIYVFMKRTGYAPTLYKVVSETYASTLSELLIYELGVESSTYVLLEQKTYSEEVNTASTECLSQVLSDVESMDGVLDLTDIFFSSHGTSWLPVGYAQTSPSSSSTWLSTSDLDSDSTMDGIISTPTLYSFGMDNDFTSTGMDVKDMAAVLEPYNLNTISFDACFMCSIEVLYELRNSAKYILSSPAEVLSDGYNYPEITCMLTSPITVDVLGVMAQKNYEKYAAMSSLTDRTGTFTVTVTEELEPLAELIGNIIKDNIAFSSESVSSVYYDGSTKYASDYFIYLSNLLTNGTGADNSTYNSLLTTLWANAFPYYYHTDMLFAKADISTSYGVAAYIYRSTEASAVNTAYKALSWAQIVGEYYY